MPLAAPARPPAPLRTPWILAGLLLAAAIAWLEPFDRLFAAASFGLPVLRACLIVALAIVGAGLGQRLHLDVAPPANLGGLVVPLALAAIVAIGCFAIDFAFGPPFSAGDAGLTHTPLAVCLPVFMMHAFNEEILYRLFLGSALASILDVVTGKRHRLWAIWSGLAVAQAVNVVVNVMAETPLTPATLLYDSLRYFAPGLIWGWLYVRWGFRSAELGHVGVHLVFQPLLGLLLIP